MQARAGAVIVSATILLFEECEDAISKSLGLALGLSLTVF